MKCIPYKSFLNDASLVIYLKTATKELPLHISKPVDIFKQLYKQVLIKLSKIYILKKNKLQCKIICFTDSLNMSR